MKIFISTIKKIAFGLMFSATFLSCSDWLEVQPKDEMILEDYWKTAEHVESAIAGCYRAMLEGDCIARMMVWGELRSDNFAARSISNDQRQMMQQNILTSNGYAKWGSFYTAINNCNTVLYYAPNVMDRDPNFDIGTLRSYQAEALTVRALLYFYLVRAFRDVPFILTPTKDDTERFTVPKETAENILNHLIEDLILAKSYAVESWNNDPNHAYNKGRVTKQAVRALLADIYLWKQQYDKCIQECDEFLAANEMLDEMKQIKLIESEYMFRYIFYLKNSSESIFELQFSQNKRNSNLQSLYGTSTARGSIIAPNSEGSWTFIPGEAGSPYGQTDVRGLDFAISGSHGSHPWGIFKYTGNRRTENMNGLSSYEFGSEPANWIFYRLPDIYLMRAEALVEQGGDNNLREALEMVNYTYMRSNPDVSDPLVITDYSTQREMRDLVLEERRREFAFEGKRWFDLVRLSEREGDTERLVAFISVALNSDASILALAKNKLAFIDALYMPIHNDEIKSNPELEQNPFYDSGSSIIKN